MEQGATTAANVHDLFEARKVIGCNHRRRVNRRACSHPSMRDGGDLGVRAEVLEQSCSEETFEAGTSAQDRRFKLPGRSPEEWRSCQQGERTNRVWVIAAQEFAQSSLMEAPTGVFGEDADAGEHPKHAQ